MARKWGASINQILKELTKRIPGMLAFDLLLLVLAWQVGDGIPQPYRPVPYLLALMVIVLYGLLEFQRIRSRYFGTKTAIKVTGVRAETGGQVNIANELKQTILHQNIQANPQVTAQVAQRLLDDYLDW